MKTSVLGSVAVLSFIGVMSAGCSPMTSQQPKTITDFESLTSVTTLTAGEPLPPNNAPLEAWGTTDEKPAAEAPISTWTTPPQAEPAAEVPAAAPVAAPVTAPAQPGVAPLDPWSYP